MSETVVPLAGAGDAEVVIELVSRLLVELGGTALNSGTSLGVYGRLASESHVGCRSTSRGSGGAGAVWEAGGEVFGDVLDLDGEVGGVCATSEVEEAAGVVGEEDACAGGADVVELAIKDAMAECGSGEGGGAAEAAADLRFCERDDLGAGEAANELIKSVAATEDVGSLAKAVDGNGAAVAAGEAAVGEAGGAGEVFGEVVDAALKGTGAGGPDRVALEEALVVVKHGDGAGGRGRHDIS